MEVFHDTLLDSEGNIINGATVDVYLYGTTTHATLYEDDAATSLSNPFSTGYSDSKGEIRFAVADGLYDIKIYTGSETIWHRKVSIFDASNAALSQIKIAVLGTSESVIPFGETFVNQLQGLFDSANINAKVVNTGYAGMSAYQAINTVDSYDGLTPVERVVNVDPDIVIMPHVINDIIVGVDGRTLAQTQGDASSLYAYLNNNTTAYLLYNRTTPYDHEGQSTTSPNSIRRGYCAPWMHETSTVSGDSGLYTSEFKHLYTILSSGMQVKLENWRSLNTTVEGLADGTAETSYFRALRLGFHARERSHTSRHGHWMYTSKIWDYFMTDSSIRSAVPELTSIYAHTDIRPWDTIWESLMIQDSYGLYQFDPDYLSNAWGKIWPDDISFQQLIRGIEYWGNELTPQICMTNYIDLSGNEDFIMTMDGLNPGKQVYTKIWKGTSAEPTSWTAFSPIPRYIDNNGGYADITPYAVIQAGFTIGAWYLKVKVDSDAFGPYLMYVSS